VTLLKLWENPMLSVEDRLDAAGGEIERLHEQLGRIADALMEKERDARRYRWLRAAPPESVRWPRWRLAYWTGKWWDDLQGDALDTALDGCMQGELLELLTPNVEVRRGPATEGETK